MGGFLWGFEVPWEEKVFWVVGWWHAIGSLEILCWAPLASSSIVKWEVGFIFWMKSVSSEKVLHFLGLHIKWMVFQMWEGVFCICDQIVIAVVVVLWEQCLVKNGKEFGWLASLFTFWCCGVHLFLLTWVRKCTWSCPPSHCLTQMRGVSGLSWCKLFSFFKIFSGHSIIGDCHVQIEEVDALASWFELPLKVAEGVDGCFELDPFGFVDMARSGSRIQTPKKLSMNWQVKARLLWCVGSICSSHVPRCGLVH